MLILFKGWSDTIFEVHFAEKKAILQGKLSCKLWGKIIALKKLLWFFSRNLILAQISQFSSVESHFQLNLSSSPKHQIFVAIFMAQAIIFRLILCLSWLPESSIRTQVIGEWRGIE